MNHVGKILMLAGAVLSATGFVGCMSAGKKSSAETKDASSVTQKDWSRRVYEGGGGQLTFNVGGQVHLRLVVPNGGNGQSTLTTDYTYVFSVSQDGQTMILLNNPENEADRRTYYVSPDEKFLTRPGMQAPDFKFASQSEDGQRPGVEVLPPNNGGQTGASTGAFLAAQQGYTKIWGKCTSDDQNNVELVDVALNPTTRQVALIFMPPGGQAQVLPAQPNQFGTGFIGQGINLGYNPNDPNGSGTLYIQGDVDQFGGQAYHNVHCTSAL